MKKITLLVLCLTVSFWSYSQCTTITGDNYGNLVVANDGTAEQIAADNWPNAEYSAIENLIIGNTYTVTGTNTTSIYITIAEIDWAAPVIGGTVLGHGASSVDFTATTTDVIIHWHLDAACTTQASDATVTTIQCTSASCSCTASSAPDGGVATTPIDGAIDVAIDNSGANPGISFEWTDNGEATSYDFNIVGVGTASGVTNPTTITYSGWAYDTTFSWSITSRNCLGEVTSANFSFTTEADPALSTAEINTQLFSVYPNPVKNKVTIDTNLKIDNITIFNQLGQNVLQVKGENIINKKVDLTTLTTGLYFMNISAEDETQSIKIIKE